MRVDLFDYHLPEELIAQEPLEDREASRMLVVDCESRAIEHRVFRDLPTLVEEGDCMVFNESRVRRARLRGVKEGNGGRAELLLLRSAEDGAWEALARPFRRLREGSRISFGSGKLLAEVVERKGEGLVRVRLETSHPGGVEEAVERLGEVPLPPYIRARLEDPERYQTVFARRIGSAAAPTAGLHFAPATLDALRSRGVRLAFLRLDVSLDTFRPLACREVEEHRMHSEEVEVGEEVCRQVGAARREGKKVIAVGTTVARALESAALSGELQPFRGMTDLYIYPGYRFRVVDCLLTNFHLPRSSLLVMVSAFAGRKLVLEAYRRAVERGYRFLSFGDVCYFHYPHGWRPPGD
ncbi:MAG: tRNA preQ1(34) S-adenosylmethionine ribosyltransferase-isomerase QueA [Actinomycetota bacterium]|nr:tRNA preQ1(34) S-adenosylmethionine ribosyltransferase-isomerase QueA [Actinomycetota bacterium]MDI7252051.1 tRNA preQ1(34) S-adenosylmethionine ribosyltransferase-isomerase QueA [Actinomycetota bacterium]